MLHIISSIFFLSVILLQSMQPLLLEAVLLPIKNQRKSLNTSTQIEYKLPQKSFFVEENIQLKTDYVERSRSLEYCNNRAFSHLMDGEGICIF